MKKNKRWISFLLAAFLGLQVVCGAYGNEEEFFQQGLDFEEEEIVSENEEIELGEIPWEEENRNTETESLAGAEVLVGNEVVFEEENSEEVSENTNENTNENISEENGEELSTNAGEETNENQKEENDEKMEEEENTEEDLQDDELLDEGELIQKIDEGEIIALSPCLEMEGMVQGKAMTLAASAVKYTLVQTSSVALKDKYGSWTRTGYRRIRYTDTNGKTVYSPLYCMNASKTSSAIQGIPDQTTVATADAPIRVYETLKNTDLQKILYFGYGGPGDITGKYDPTSASVDWSKWQNKYAFTHFALSYVYSKDLGNVTVARAKEAGLFDFINYCKKQTIPSFNDLTFSIRKSNSNAAATTYSTGRNIASKFTLQRVSDKTIASKTGFTDGYQITNVIAINGCSQNYIPFTTHTDSSVWQILYWKSESDYKSKGLNGAIVAAPGSALKLYGGYRFMIVASKKRVIDWKMNLSMGLRPVQFLLVKGQSNVNYPQYDFGTDQDFGAFVYSDTAASMSLLFTPQPYTAITLKKVSEYNGESIAGAKFSVYAGAAIYSGTNLMYAKDAKIETFTMTAGEYMVKYCYPGSYYFIEEAPPSGYKITNGNKIAVTVPLSACATEEKTYTLVPVSVNNTPDIQVEIVLKKVDQYSEQALSGAVFAIDEWNGSAYVENKNYSMVYQKTDQQYHSDKKLVWTTKNKGKFRIREVKPPAGYSGEYVKTFTIGENYPKYQSSIHLGYVKNKKEVVRKIQIKKKDEKTAKVLLGAEFTLYEWSKDTDSYNQKEILKWNSSLEVYESSVLNITAENLGKFWVVETKNPEGYIGEYQEEFILKEEDQVGIVYRTVTNKSIKNITGSVSISKQDAKTKSVLLDAEFMVYEWDAAAGKYMDTLKDNRTLIYQENTKTYVGENFTWTEENQGKFLVRETKNPEGYTGEFEQEFVLKEGQENKFSYTVLNDPVTRFGKITITKKIKEADINWANGNPTFLFVVEGTDINGIKHRYEDYLVYIQNSGIYQVDTQGYASLSLTFEDIPEGSYQIYEKPVARYYLAEMKAVTENVSIWSSGKIGYGISPDQSFRGNAVLSYSKEKDLMYAEVVFRNEKHRWDQFSHTDVIKNSIR